MINGTKQLKKSVVECNKLMCTKNDSNQAELWALYLAYNSIIDAEILIDH